MSEPKDRDWIECQHGTPGCRGWGDKHACTWNLAQTEAAPDNCPECGQDWPEVMDRNVKAIRAEHEAQLAAANARTEEFKREVERRDEYLRGADADVNAYRERAEKACEERLIAERSRANAYRERDAERKRADEASAQVKEDTARLDDWSRRVVEAEQGAAVLRETLGGGYQQGSNGLVVNANAVTKALSSNAGKQRSEDFAALKAELEETRLISSKNYQGQDVILADLRTVQAERDALKADLAEAVGQLRAVHPPHPQPEICSACGTIARVKPEGTP